MKKNCYFMKTKEKEMGRALNSDGRGKMGIHDFG
jgi:hypothetical protein